MKKYIHTPTREGIRSSGGVRWGVIDPVNSRWAG